jgi:hypothetical protein
MAKTIYCSFCGRSSAVAGKMMESSDRADPRNIIRICMDCAKMAVGMLNRLEKEKKPKRKRKP